MLWFNSSQQLRTTQPLTRSSLSQWDEEEIGKKKPKTQLVGWEKNGLITKPNYNNSAIYQ